MSLFPSIIFFKELITGPVYRHYLIELNTFDGSALEKFYNVCSLWIYCQLLIHNFDISLCAAPVCLEKAIL